jgi:hypothetical protein
MGRAWTSEKSQPGVKEKIPGLVLPAFAGHVSMRCSSLIAHALVVHGKLPSRPHSC